MDSDIDVNMKGKGNGNDNEFDEIGFLTLSELQSVRIDYNGNDKNNGENDDPYVKLETNDNDYYENDINYFDEIDDGAFTQIIINANNGIDTKNNENKTNSFNEKNNENENEYGIGEFDVSGFADDNEILQYVKRIEESKRT
eukprot:UN07679